MAYYTMLTLISRPVVLQLSDIFLFCSVILVFAILLSIKIHKIQHNSTLLTAFSFSSGYKKQHGDLHTLATKPDCASKQSVSYTHWSKMYTFILK